MTNLGFLQLDIFPASLGVVHGAKDWSDEAMQRFAAWTNLVETTFLLPPSAAGASYRVRIFTPRREIAFAGHPSIGSAHAALELGANGLIAAYLGTNGTCGAHSYRVSQGREVGHDAEIHLAIDASGEVWVGGRTDTIIRGNLRWPGRLSRLFFRRARTGALNARPDGTVRNF